MKAFRGGLVLGPGHQVSKRSGRPGLGLATCLALMVLFSAQGSYGDFDFTEMSAVSSLFNLQDNGGGYVGYDGNDLRIGTNVDFGAGTAWLMERQSVASGFRTTFTYRVSDADPDGAADGFGFIIQNHSDTAFTVSSADFGVGGLPKQVVVEFDSYFNFDVADSPGDHIEVRSNGLGAYSGFCCILPAVTGLDYRNLGEGYWNVTRTNTLTIIYNPGTPNGTLTVQHPDTSELTVTIPNLDTYLDLGDGTAWVGFGSGTGVGHQRTLIQAWSFQTGVFGPIYVDFALGDDQNAGISVDNPVKTLSTARDIVTSGGTVRIQAGTSDETILITKAMTLEAIGGTVRIGASEGRNSDTGRKSGFVSRD